MAPKIPSDDGKNPRFAGIRQAHRPSVFFLFLPLGWVVWEAWPFVKGVLGADGQFPPKSNVYWVISAILLVILLFSCLALLRQFVGLIRAWWRRDETLVFEVDQSGISVLDPSVEMPRHIRWQDIRYFCKYPGVVNFDVSGQSRKWDEVSLVRDLSRAQKTELWQVVRHYWPILDDSWQHQLVKRTELDLDFGR